MICWELYLKHEVILFLSQPPRWRQSFWPKKNNFQLKGKRPLEGEDADDDICVCSLLCLLINHQVLPLTHSADPTNHSWPDNYSQSEHPILSRDQQWPIRVAGFDRRLISRNLGWGEENNDIPSVTLNTDRLAEFAVRIIIRLSIIKHKT